MSEPRAYTCPASEQLENNAETLDWSDSGSCLTLCVHGIGTGAFEKEALQSTEEVWMSTYTS